MVPREAPAAPARKSHRSRVFDADGGVISAATPRALAAELASAASLALPLPPALARLVRLQAALDTALVLASVRAGGGARSAARAHAYVSLAPVVEAAAREPCSAAAVLALAAVGGGGYRLSPRPAGDGGFALEMAGCGHVALATVCAACARAAAPAHDAWLQPRRAAFLAAAERIVHAAHGRHLRAMDAAGGGGAEDDGGGDDAADVARSEGFFAACGRLHGGFDVDAVALPAARLLLRPGSGAKLAGALHAQFTSAGRGALPLAALLTGVRLAWASAVAEADIDAAVRELAARGA